MAKPPTVTKELQNALRTAISEAEALKRSTSTASGPSYAIWLLSSLSTVISPEELFTCTTGPCLMNRPVNCVASVR